MDCKYLVYKDNLTFCRVPYKEESALVLSQAISNLTSEEIQNFCQKDFALCQRFQKVTKNLSTDFELKNTTR